MHTGFFDVLHHTADEHLAGVVANRVHVDFGRVLEESIDEHRTFGRQAAFLTEASEARELGHGPSQVFAIVNDLHGATAEHVTRAHQNREADVGHDRLGLGQRDRRAAGWLRNVEIATQRVPLLAILGQVDR